MYNNKMNSIKSILQRWILYFWIRKIVKKNDPHRLLLNFADKINLKMSYKYAVLSNLSIQYT